MTQPVSGSQGQIVGGAASIDPGPAKCVWCLKKITRTVDGTWFDGKDYWCSGDSGHAGNLHEPMPDHLATKFEAAERALRDAETRALEMAAKVADGRSEHLSRLGNYNGSKAASRIASDIRALARPSQSPEEGQ